MGTIAGILSVLGAGIGAIAAYFKFRGKARDDAETLGKDENELDHVKLENADRAAMEAVPPATPAALDDSLRTGRF